MSQLRKRLMGKDSVKVSKCQSVKKALAGFMLLEVIMSVVIIASGVVFVIRSYSVSLRATETAKRLTKAVFFLEDELCELELKGAQVPGERAGAVEGDSNYAWRLTVDHLNETETIKLNRVELSAAYTYGGASRSVVVSTYMKDKEA